MRKLFLATATLLALSCPALAQQQTGPQNPVTCAFNSNPPTVTSGFFGYVQCDSAGRLVVASNGPYPSGATPITASTTGTTTAFSVALPAVASRTTYICGFIIGAQATAATSGLTFISGTVSNSINFLQPIAAVPAVGTLPQQFSPCIPASAVNTPITVFSAPAGAGGSAAITAWGFQL